MKSFNLISKKVHWINSMLMIGLPCNGGDLFKLIIKTLFSDSSKFLITKSHLLFIFFSLAIGSVQLSGQDVPIFEYWTGEGNYGSTNGGLTFFEFNSTGSFTVDIPDCGGSAPAIERAYLTWFHRDFEGSGSPAAPDGSINFNFNGGGFIAVANDENYIANPVGGAADYHHVLADVTALVNGNAVVGSNTVDITGLDSGPNILQHYGVALTIIYECAATEPYNKTSFFIGNDFFLCDGGGGNFDYAHEYSMPYCFEFPAQATDQTLNYSGIIGGQANASAPFRGGNIAFLTGNGLLPPAEDPIDPAGNIYNDPAAVYTTNPTWTSNLGIEWDRIEETLTIPAGDTWVCVQAQSVQDVGTAHCGSLNMVAFTLTMPVEISPPTGDCACKEYIYLNDVDLDVVHKFEINPTTGALTEIGSPWLGANVIQDPHGIVSDINGYLYISENQGGNSAIHRVSCDGDILDPNVFTISGGSYVTRLQMLDEVTLYANDAGAGELYAYDVCSGTALGSVSTPSGWGFTLLDNGTDYLIGSWPGPVYVGPNDLSSSAAAINPPAPPAATPYALGFYQDGAGNYYVVWNATQGLGGTGAAQIIKYDVSWNQLATTGIDNTQNTTGWFGARGITGSDISGKIYVGSFDECVAVFDAGTMAFEPVLSVPHVPGSQPKDIGIAVECCPTSTPLSFTRSVCYSGGAETVYLQNFLDCDGPICGGTWIETTSNPNFTFDNCANSVVVSGPGCAVYTLSGDASSPCGTFSIEVEICAGQPSATVTGAQGTCTGSTPNNDASLALSNVVNGDEAGISAGATYTGPAYGDAANIDVSSGTGSFTGLMHNTQYTIRIFNGANDCFVDETVTTPMVNCTTPCPDPNCFNISVTGNSLNNKNTKQN